MLIYQDNNDFATSVIAKSLETSITICLCARKTLHLKERRENIIKELLNINVNFKNFDYKTLFYYILPLNDDSLFNVTLKFIRDIMESFFIQNLKEIYYV